jgi:hypothetical protein
MVCIFSADDPTIVEALTLATAGAGYEWIGWGGRPPGEVRATWRLGAAVEHTPLEADPLSRAVAERVAGASLNVLRVRGEPAVWSTLHAAIYAELAQSGLLAQVARLADDIPEPLSWLTDIIRSALDGAPLRQILSAIEDESQDGLVEPVWWLDEPLEAEAVSPLNDRIELAVAEILRELLAVTEIDLDRRVCARLPGPQTPDAHLIRLCLLSYGDEYAPGHWRLRSEDELEARATEIDAVIGDLASLGQRLGFEVALGDPRAGEWAVRWHDETGQIPYVFAVRTTAVLSDLLFEPPPLQPNSLNGNASAPSDAIPGHQRRGLGIAEWSKGDKVESKTTPCLTLPGGRAIVVSYKLRHDPRLRKQVARHGWQFLKFRHLRHLVQKVTAKQLDRYAFQAALGLDPIVEQEEAQMSLW